MAQSGRTAIVTGASRGIGAAIAQRLALDGFAVVVNFAAREDDAQKQVTHISRSGGLAICVRADIGEPLGARSLFDAAESNFGSVDVLVNNAGIKQLRPIADTDDDFFERHIAVNLKGTFNGMREAARRLRNGGRVISVSASAAGLYAPAHGAYAATKSGIEALTLVLAREMRGRNITVNAVAPGPTVTELLLSGQPSNTIEHLTKLAPLERLGQPQDVAGVVSFLAGPDGAWVNGQVLRADGGI